MKNIIIGNKYIEVVDNKGENFDIIDVIYHEKFKAHFYKLVIGNPAPKFTIDELKIIQELLWKAMDYGEEYPKIKEYVNLYEKISEEIDINS